jgi:hypothetical protein
VLAVDSFVITYHYEIRAHSLIPNVSRFVDVCRFQRIGFHVSVVCYPYQSEGNQTWRRRGCDKKTPKIYQIQPRHEGSVGSFKSHPSPVSNTIVNLNHQKYGSTDRRTHDDMTAYPCTKFSKSTSKEVYLQNHRLENGHNSATRLVQRMKASPCTITPKATSKNEQERRRRTVLV